ncbi:MAG: hypothetical protein HY332_00295 [Chloroflexi bacterium]|nr:hypothetical protein [Chloroflexota bacterium]
MTGTIVEHDRLQVTIDGERGWFAVVDKTSGVEWVPDPWFRSAGEVVVEAQAGGARIACDLSRSLAIAVERTAAGARITFDELSGADGTEVSGSRVVARLELAEGEPELLLTLDEVRLDEDRFALVAIQYPLRFGALTTIVEPGALVLPFWSGTLVPTGYVDLATVNFWEFEDRSRGDTALNEIPFPSMPWYGVQRDAGGQNGAGGFLCILETADDVALQTVANYNLQHAYDARGEVSPLPRIAAVSPKWLSSRSTLGYPRRARFVFGPDLDYVAMAKRYRRYARAIGELKTLREKASERPAAARLAGAPCIALYGGYPHHPPTYPTYSYRYADVARIVRDLHGALQLPAAFVHLWGAFTRQPPHALPFDTAPGPIKDLRAAIQAAHDAGYLFALYNDVTALLEESPHWDASLMNWTEPGHPQVGGRWNRVCSSQFVPLLHRFMPEVVRELGLLATYVDCVNIRWKECYSPLHPLTRAQDRANRREVARYLHSLGLVYGGEHLQSYAVPEVEYCNGMSIPITAPTVLRTFPVPLWHLVFHDAAVAYCHAIDDYTATRGTDFTDKLLRDLLLGVPPLYFLNVHDYPAWRGRIAMAHEATGKVVRHVAFDEMESHAFLSDDHEVQVTRFASGIQVAINFGLRERDGPDGKLPPKGFRVSGLGDRPRAGSFALTYRP